ncbi:MAG: response regulator [Pseudobdellovibrionaceae bacterium]|nr:response regulator [Pseudobdellovibrionaceae bacterium]
MQRQLRIFAEHIINTVREPLLVLNRNYSVMMANPAFYETFCACPVQTRGRSFFDIANPGWHQESLRLKLQAVFSENQEFEDHEVTCTVAGGLKVFHINARRLDTLGDSSKHSMDNVLLAFQDVSERKRAEWNEREKVKAELANQTKSSFLANLSHEIRTPLSSIIGFADLLQREVDPDSPRATYVEIIRNNARHLLDLVGEVLDLSKIEARKFDLTSTEVFLFHEIGLVFDILRSKAKEKNLTLELVSSPHVPEVIFTDPTRFRQILINLLGNAIKFTHQGGVTVLVNHCNNGLLQISVVDTGIGIPASMQELIFDQFGQAKMPSAKNHEGTGLGLTLSRELARLLGGDIVLSSSEEGKGSRFDIFIHPGAVNRSSERLAPMPPTAITRLEGHLPTLQGIRVLLAEDGIDIQALYERILTYEGADVEVVENGEEAIRAATSQHFDIVLMDHRMPVLDGLEATTRLRALGYTSPILALTANATMEEREASLAAGCNDFLCKPIDAVTLCESVAKWGAPKLQATI